jgi:hypothetical protein
MGLAGMGLCSARGWWWDEKCPFFQTEEDLEIEWKEVP